MCSSEILWFPDFNSKTLCLINLKLNRVILILQGLDAFKIEVGSFAYFG